jgi:general secretion pathway protein A
MYAAFYNLTGRPFQLTPDPRFYYSSRTHKKAMAYLTYGMNQGEGFIVITGDIGAGKTTLVGRLFDELDREKYIAANVVTTQLDADNVLRMVAKGFGIAQEGLDKATILERIEAFLIDSYNRGKRVLLVVDESQNLPTSALEELRMLSNFQFGDRPLVQSFLLGQPQFRDKLASDPDLEQLRQRVIATYHLEPMQEAETASYIEHRLQHVGWKDDPSFTRDAFRRIHNFTGGVPRKVNTLASRLLLFGYLEELHEINLDVVNEVIEDLERDNEGREPEEPVIGEVEIPAKKTVEKAAPVAPKKKYIDSDLDRRIEMLERNVLAQQKTLDRALEIVASYFDRVEGSESRDRD